MSFDDWMTAVDNELDKICGLDSAGLPDCDYWNWWNQGISAKTAASRAIKNAGGF